MPDRVVQTSIGQSKGVSIRSSCAGTCRNDVPVLYLIPVEGSNEVGYGLHEVFREMVGRMRWWGR